MKRQVFRIDKGMVTIWKQYANQVLGLKDYFDNKCVGITYDKWAVDAAYRDTIRKQLTTKFGWETSNEDVGVNRVARGGGGSSFDTMDFDGNAQEMKVTARWKDYADHPLMVKLCDEETLELNTKLLEG
jgi:hypothetical protein